MAVSYPESKQSHCLFISPRLSAHTQIRGYLREEPPSVLTKLREKTNPDTKSNPFIQETGSLTNSMATSAACDIRAEGKEQRHLWKLPFRGSSLPWNLTHAAYLEVPSTLVLFHNRAIETSLGTFFSNIFLEISQNHMPQICWVSQSY